tara:strand:+ start:169 stop:363 length:195 start_codon:yes stop_codon:yes gene_type:complete
MDNKQINNKRKYMKTKSITKQITQWNEISNYDKLFNVLIEWYNEKQIDQIWELLKKYDKTIKIK